VLKTKDAYSASVWRRLILIKAPLNHTRNRYDSRTQNLFPRRPL
jgi:hypothetical protein